mgnify:CR=1 FL=1
MVPETLRDSLVARLDRFGPAKEVAQIGAAIGREFSHRLLSAVASLPPDRLSAALEDLAGAELIFASGDSPETIYTFKHALVQDAAYSTLLKSRRRQLHAGIVTALERDFPDQVQAQPELIAYHATNAEQFETAVGYWCKAGERGLARAAMKEANAVYSRALDLARRLQPSDRRERAELEILLELGRTQQAIRGSVSDECGQTFGRARQLAERSGRAEHLVEALKGLMYFHHGRTELKRAAKVADARLKLSKRLGWQPEIVAAYDDLATVSFSNGDFQHALDLSSSALSIIEAADRYSWSSDIEDVHRSVLILCAQTMTVLGFRAQAGEVRAAGWF